ncbi:ankyrin-2-like isoform X3 [Chironomus tepperi]|uniref:ankyrin-2-like isoform X3 n=1 Tax=Chironomus tepperi TaxID=113505 RepID=UPI00391F4827
MQFVTHINPSLQESQSGHHPGHHGHSAPHSSTLPHQIHSGGGNIAHQINLDSLHPHEKHHHHHQNSNKRASDSHHQAHHTSHHTTHHHHHSDGNTSFLRAARAGNLEKVLEHLKNNIDINTCNANGLNALHLASKDGHISVVSELLSRGAIVDAATKKGNTALHIASLAGQEEVVKLLIQHNASVNVQSQNGFTPLYMAAQENHDSVVKLLLANGANQSLATEDGFTPLAVAMQQGHDKVVAVLLESDTRGKVRLPALHIAAKKDDVKAASLLLENDHNPDVTSKSGFTPLHIASHYGNEGIANLLIQKGADVNYAAKHSITPLHVAAKWGKTNMVALLLDKGANIESKTRDGLTPLHCAARSGHEQVVDILLERGAPISSKTKNGLAPLHMAAQGEHVDAARILLYHRAPVDEVTVDYLTALHVAAHCGHVRVAKLLLDRNADANARALNGFTPLHIACKKNRIKVVELLLKHGASIGATTESGLTPLHVASFMGCMNIVIYLLQHDASPDVPTVRGETPLHLAARANQTDIIRILLRNGAQVDARAREQQTPLHIASRLGNVDIVMLLLQHGAQVDAVTKDMYTALHIAAKEGQDEVAAVLLDNGAQIDSTTKKGFTPLHLTAKYGNIKVAQLLLSKNAPVDAQGKNGVTPLHVASHYDHQNVALLLLEKGASPHATAKNGHTPLHIAARKNQMDIATTLLEYGAQSNAESKAGFTPLHLSSQEGHTDMSSLLLEHKADSDHQARNGLTPLHLCAQEDKVQVAQILVKHGANIEAQTKAGYTPLHVASHFGQANMVRYLIEQGGQPNAATGIGYTPLHQAAQQGHLHIVQVLVENKADPNLATAAGQTPLHIAQKLGYISVYDSLKPVTDSEVAMTTSMTDEKYRVVAPEAMHETFMSDSEEEGEDTALSDQPYRYLTVDEMKSLGDDSLPIDVTRDERVDNKMITSIESTTAKPPQALEDSISPQHISMQQTEAPVGKSVTDYAVTSDNIVIDRHPQHVGFLVSFLVDARGGAMRGCRHSGVRIIVPARSAAQPTRITCRYVKPQRTMHPPPLMEGEALASRVLELGPVGAKFLGPVIMEVPHFASLRGKEREIVILRSDNGETWREHTIENSDEIISEVLNDCFEPEDIAQMDELGGGRICRFVTYDFPQYFAVISRIHQEVHAIGPEGGMVSSTVVPQVQAVFPQGALTKKIKVGLQAQPIDPELTAKLLGRGVAVSPVVTVEPRRRKFHKAITLSIPTPRAHSQGMINQYSGNAPTLRLLCSITGGTTRAQWEDVTGSTPLTFVNDCVSFTTTVSARFWLMDCRNIADATKMATELYKEAIHVPFMAKFVVFAKRVDPMEARLRVFCMTDDREDKTLEQQENFSEVAKSRDVEVLENKIQYLELAGNLIPVTKSGEQLQFPFKAFKENRLPFSVRVKDQHADTVGRALFMREPKVAKGEQPQTPICILNIVLPEDIIPEQLSILDGSQEVIQRIELSSHIHKYPDDYMRGVELRMSDVSNLLGDDWIKLAPEIGITEQEVEDIIENYSNSTAQQAQAMLKLFQTKKQNDINILENGLRSIDRDDIVERCLIRKITTSTVTKRQQKRSNDTNGYEESDLIKDSESLEDLNKKRYGRYEHDESKYSAEEKVIESEEDEIEAAKRSVAERREKIEKRLSGEQKHFPSTQQKEIVEEIITIKRQSLIEDARAKHEDEILMQKPVDNSYKSSTVPEQVVKLKTTSHDSSSVDKSEFEKELQDKFQKTLGDVEKFEHKFTHEAIPVTLDFLASEIQQSTEEKDLPEKIISTVSKTTTITEAIPDEVLTESSILKKREIITTTTTTSSDGDSVKNTMTQFYDQGDDITDEFEKIEREVMDPTLVDEILEEARQKADNIQSKVITNTTTTTVHPGETKEIITTTTTIRTIESINLDDVSDSRLDNLSDEEELIQQKSVESTQKPAITPPPTPLDGRSSDVQQLPDQIKFDKFGVESAEEHDSDSVRELHSHQTTSSSIISTEARQIPKPTPRLNKSATNDTYNSSISSQVDDTSTSSASHTLKSDIESEISDDHVTPAKMDDQSFKQKKQFWENFDHPILPAPIPRPRIAKSQRDSKDSFETETSSLRSSKDISKDEEERLEDESFPISDRYDSDASEKAVVVPIQKKILITDMDKIDSFEPSETDDDGAKFYIGESSTNVIRKSANEKRADFAFDNHGYEFSIDTDESTRHHKREVEDFIHQDIQIYDDSLLSKNTNEAHLVAHSIGDEMDSKMDLILDEKSEFEMSEKLSRQQSEEFDSASVAIKPPVIHSPIKNETILETEKPLEMPEEHITIAKASAVEVLKDSAEPKKFMRFENLPDLQASKESFRLDTTNKNTEEEIEKTLEEVEDSLSAVQEELIEVVKDGKLIKQSPSEFEIKILPDLKYPASIPEQEELPDTPKKEQCIKIKEPEKYEKPKQSETEESQLSSNEDSFNKLDVTHRQKSKSTSNRWSATDIESSSESHYQSFEKTDSRPLSSDIENLAPYQSSEYETAHGQSIVSGSTTLDYQSAVSTLNSRDSMKSLDSESSGNLASIETSEASETLVPSTMEECDEALLTDVIAHELESDEKDSRFTSLESETLTKSEDDVSSSIPHSMKRSHEMHFSEVSDPITKFEETLGKSVEDLKYGSWEEPKFGSSLEEGSILSVSISSASNLETMVEIHSDHADQLMGSLVGSYDSAKIFTSFTDDAAGTTSLEFDSSVPEIETKLMASSKCQEDDQNNVSNDQIAMTEESEPTKKRGHKRTDSTSVFASGFVKAESKESGSDSFDEDIILHEDSSDVISSEKDETHGESSDSEYDRYESEYARAYRLPISSQSKSKGKENVKETIDEKKFSSPGHSIIETIVEDVHEEIEQISDHLTDYKKPQDYEIPNIEVTHDLILNEEEILLDSSETTTQNIQYAKQVEYKMSEEEYQELLEKKYASRLADMTKTYDDNIYDEQQPSPGSDSFEMLNEPDISDEFVIIEEVAKEAHEFDQEGKSVSIQSIGKKYITKHDEEMEKYVVKSAPAATDAGSFAAGFEFEESPPQDDDNGDEPLRGNGYSLEGRKGWVEMNLSDPANLRYPYDLEPRGVLEDIKEEDTDFEVGSSRISSFKDSYSSTPDYDALVRKFHSREHDNLSMNSLQEFENLERVISLENRQKHSQSSQESLSNGSYPKRGVAKSIHGDDISLSSLKEFEGLENACLEAHLLEIRAKEEAALLLSRSDDSNNSGSSTGAKSSPKTASSSPGGKVQQQIITSVTTTTVVKGRQSSQMEQQMANEFQKLQQRAQEIMEDKSISIMETSTDSLEEKAPKQIYDRTSSQHVSSDSLDKDLKSADPMTSSVDSIEMSRGGGERTGKSSDVDSIEQSSPIKKRSDSIDSIDLQIAACSSTKIEKDSFEDIMNFELSNETGSSSKKVITKTLTGTDGQTVTTTITSTTVRYDMPQQKDISSDSLNVRTEPDMLLTSTESLETSSTATNATYQNETDSQMSGSITSCGSTTMIEMDPITSYFSPSSSTHHITSTTTSTTTYSNLESDLSNDDFKPISFTVKKSNQ